MDIAIWIVLLVGGHLVVRHINTLRASELTQEMEDAIETEDMDNTEDDPQEFTPSGVVDE